MFHQTKAKRSGKPASSGVLHGPIEKPSPSAEERVPFPSNAAKREIPTRSYPLMMETRSERLFRMLQSERNVHPACIMI